MKKSKSIRKKLLKITAVASAFTILMCGGMEIIAPLSISANAVSSQSDSTVATDIKIFNSNGENVSVGATEILYNSECHFPNHRFTNEYEATVTKKATTENGKDKVTYYTIKEVYYEFTIITNNAYDELVVSKSGSTSWSPTDYLFVKNEGDGIYTVRLTTMRVADKSNDDGSISRKKSGYLDTDDGRILLGVAKEGVHTFSFTTKNGKVYRTLNVQVTALTDLTSATVTADKTVLKDSKGNINGLLAITGHQQQITVKSSGSKYCVPSIEVVDENDEPTDKAEISSSGLLTPKKNGTCYIKVGYKDGETHYKWNSKDGYSYISSIYIPCVIVLSNPAKSIDITNAPDIMDKNEELQLKLDKAPTYNGDEYATSATDIITWSTSDKNVLSVDENGVLTAVGSGVATVTAQGENSKVYSTKQITVIAKAESIKVNESPVSVTVGDTIEVTATMQKKDANEHIYWYSSDNSIATVSYDENAIGNTQTATIRGIKEGTIELTAKTESGKEYVATVTIIPMIKVIDFNVTDNEGNIDNELTLYTGESITLSGVSNLSNGSVSNEVEWTVIDDNKNTLYSQDGTKLVVKGLSGGTAVIKATSKADPAFTKMITVNILKSADKITIKNDKDEVVNSVKILLNSSCQLKAVLTIDSMEPDNHDDTVVSWQSSDTDIVKVANNGLLIPCNVGKANIFVTSASGLTKKVTVTVKAVSRVEIKGVSSTVDVPLTKSGITKKFSVTVYDENNETMSGITPTWQSSNTKIATVDEDGIVTFHSAGKATLTAKVNTKLSFVTLNVQAVMANCQYSTIANQTYSPAKKSYTPSVTIKYNGVTLKNGTDYTLTYKNNTKVGTAQIVVTGKGNYAGTKTLSFKIVPRNIEYGISVSGVSNKTYTGSAITQSPKVYNNGVLLKSGTDYTLSYKNNTKVGKATMVIKGKGNYTGTYNKTFNITQHTLSSSNIVIAKTQYDYTGKAIKPSVTVKIGNNKISTSDYTVSYSNNVKVGTATIKVTGKGSLRGTATKTFKIMQQYPSKITISKTSYNLGVGETCKFTASVSNAQYVKNKTLYWSSSNTKVATVDKNGKVTAKNRGTAYIKVRSANGKAYAQCKLTVNYAPSSIRITTPTSNQFKSRTVKNNSVTAVTVKIGTTFQLASAVNSGSVAHIRSWSVKNSSIVSITKNTFIASFKANRVGTTYITVKTYNNKSATVKVTVVSSTSGQKITTSQANAVKMAKNYLSVMPFSRDGLVKQLEYEKFSNADAKYGADHCGANWNTQAQKMAKSYLSAMPFSYDGLIDQLEFEGFTNAQAKYGVNNCGANWNTQAQKMAKSYLSALPFSRKGLIKQLNYEKFTYNQAEYGVNNCGANWNEQAVRMAKEYVSVMSFSREGLISQLEFEGFTHAQAVYAVNKLGY